MISKQNLTFNQKKRMNFSMSHGIPFTGDSNVLRMWYVTRKEISVGPHTGSIIASKDDGRYWITPNTNEYDQFQQQQQEIKIKSYNNNNDEQQQTKFNITDNRYVQAYACLRLQSVYI